MDLYLKELTPKHLESEGAIFYMNSNNGTEYDWYVNERLPYFMVFYNDDENMGAAKLGLHQDGKVNLYLYNDQGKK